MKVVVAMNSFKGSLGAPSACRAVRRGILTAAPDVAVVLKSMADGGEGTARTLVDAWGGDWIPQQVMGPLPAMRVEAGYAWLPAVPAALVEMAAASGLELLTPPERNPLRTTTYGTGELLRAAAARGAQHIWLAIGDSATVDGGAGAAAALGWRFLDETGQSLVLGGGELERLAHIERPGPDWPEVAAVTVLSDVDHPLLGERGAARVFGPQKGADTEMVERLERGLARLAEVIERDLGFDVRELPGTGAAGGFGAGATAFFGAELRSGVQAVIEATELEDALAGADWVVTGEGRFDEQSLHGKVVAGVMALARSKGVPVAVIAGSSPILPEGATRLGLGVLEVSALEGMSLDEAIGRAEELLTEAARRFATEHLGASG